MGGNCRGEKGSWMAGELRRRGLEAKGEETRAGGERRVGKLKGMERRAEGDMRRGELGMRAEG